MTKHTLLPLAALVAAILSIAARPGPDRSERSPLAPGVSPLLQTQVATISALNANLGSGTPSNHSSVACELGGVLNSLSVGVQGSYSMTLIVQVTADGVNWITVPNSSYSKVADGTTGALSGSGMWTVPVSGIAARVTCSSFTSGSAVVSLVPYAAAAGGAGGGGGGGSVTEGTSPWVISAADGGIVTLGSDGDSATAGAGTANAHLREIATLLGGPIGITGTITSALPSGTNNIGSVTTIQQNGALTDGSGTITSGGAAQSVFASNSTRHYLLIVNNSSELLYVNFDGTAAVAGEPSIPIQPNGGSYERASGFIPSGAVSITGATTGDSFTAKQN